MTKRMKNMRILNPKKCFRTGLVVMAATLSTQAGTFTNNFDNGTPPGATVYGNTFVDTTGGVGNSGCLKLTTAINSESGSFVLPDLDSGAQIFGFDLSYDLLLGGGTATPADGVSLCFGPDLPAAAWGERGAGTGWTFFMDTYDNGTTEVPRAPCISVDYPTGTHLATSYQTIASLTTNAFVHVHLRLGADGSLLWEFRGQTIYTNLYLSAYQDWVNGAQGGQFGFGARTGGLNENAFVDNLSITTYTNPLVGISQPPFSQSVLQGDNATFFVGLGATNNATFQWYKNNNKILGATAQSLVLSNVQPADSGSIITVAATGPNNAVTSAPVTLTVTNLNIPTTPQLSFNFDNGLVPAGTAVFGTAMVDTTGGIGNSGCLKITSAQNSQNGAFVISDPDAGAPVYGFTLRCKTSVGDGTIPPADGFAIAFGTDIPADPTATSPAYESGQGLGTGLIVTWDTYNNDFYGDAFPTQPVPAPAISIWWGGNILATAPVPLWFMINPDNADGTPGYDDTIVQLDANSGTVNVVYRGALVFNRVPIPSFISASGASCAIGARTGGLNENVWVDNLQLTTATSPGTIYISTPPSSQTILIGHAYTNSVIVNTPTGVTYQWYRGSTLIPGANASTYVIPAVATNDSGATFTVQATQAGITVTSAPVTLTVCFLAAPTSPNFAFNFNDGNVPAGTSIFGNASVAPNGWVTDNSGCLHITDAVNSEAGAFVVTNLVYGGAQVSGISVAFDLYEGGGTSTPADGFSFNWDANLPTATVGTAETGAGNGVSLCFRIYVGNGNADTPPSPYIGIKYKGNFIASTQIPAVQLDTGTGARTMLFRVDPDGKAYLAYGELVLYNGLQLPNYSFTANSMFGVYGRTGGLNENQWFKNILIQATKSSGPLSIAVQPLSQTVLAGMTATFTATPSDPNGATYQWYRNGTIISGAQTTTYTTPPTTVADNGAVFYMKATGPSGTATSSNAVLTVAAPITISNPVLDFTFADGAVPDDTTLNSNSGGATSGYITPNGGPGNSGVLHLCDAVNSMEGTFIIPDPSSNQPVSGFTLTFDALISGGTVPPADGISLSFCSSNDVPQGLVTGEGGVGGGLIVAFNLYGSGSSIPQFIVKWQNNNVVDTVVPYSDFETGGNFTNCAIRLNPNGTLDVQFNDQVFANQVPLPGFAPVQGYEYVFAARTGGLNENEWISNIKIAPVIGFAKVPLTVTRGTGNITITWPGSGLKLQGSTSLSPTAWADVSTTSPYTTPTTGTSKFYRLVAQ